MVKKRLILEATSKAGPTGVLPTTGRLMDRPGLECEAAAPQRLLTIGTTGVAGRAVYEAAAHAAVSAGPIRILLTRSRRIR